MENNQERINKIKDLWNQIHGEKLSIFYWADNTETNYYYNEVTNSIDAIKDKEFKVSITNITDNITKEYIIDLIIDLQWNIIDYFRKNYYHELWYE